MDITVTLTTGTTLGPFNVYYDSVDVGHLLASNVSRADLLSGYTITGINDNAVNLIVVDQDPGCGNQVSYTFPTTTTTSTTSTTTTAAPTTTTTSTTSTTTTAAPTTTTTSTTTTTTTISYSLNVQWRIAGNVFTYGKYAYSTNGGSTWTVGGPSDFIGSGLYGTAITIYGLSNGQTILLGILNNSNSNVTFGTGNGGGYTGFCGESSPYSVTISTPGTTTVYLNVAESSAGVLQTC